MDIQRLTSELSEVPSFSSNIEKTFEALNGISEIKTLEDINSLLNLSLNLLTIGENFLTSNVNIKVMSIHARVLKPFVSNTEEDDFI